MKFKLIMLVFVLSFLSMAASQSLAEDKNLSGIDPRADQVLRQMSEYLAEQEQFSFDSEVFYDVVLEGGRKIRYNANVGVSVKRPNGFHVKFDGDRAQRRLWYDGKNLTIFNLGLGYYASEGTKPTIDGALDHVSEKLGITPPLSDFLFSNPYEVLIDGTEFGDYIGEHKLHGWDVHHLAFSNEDIDWEIWIEDGKILVPRMIVITYKKVENSPQYTAIIYNWDFSVRLPKSLFSFIAPDDAKKIKFLSASSSEGGE